MTLVSVVVPMRNEAARIGDCIRSLLGQDYPAERLEIIVADGASTDGSAAIVESFTQSDARVRLVANPRRFTAFGLNEGIRASRGDVVVILGAHSEVGREFVAESVAALDRSGADAAGGVIEAVGATPLGEAVAAAVSSRFGVGSVAFRQAEREGFVDTVAFAAYRRGVFERIGLFDEELVRDQDDELNYRLRKHGGRLFLTPRVRVRYFARPSLGSLWRQYFEYGLWKVRVLQKHPRTMQPRHFVPAASMATGGALVLAALASPPAMLLALGLAGAYLAASAVAAAALARRIGWRRFPLLFAAFPVLHVGYGTGFLVGLLRFLRRWWLPEPAPPGLEAKR